MDPRFAVHNRHQKGIDIFLKFDPNLEVLGTLPFVYRFPLLEQLPSEPGIYSITGGRQIGKSTVLKQRMADLAASGVNPSYIAYFTGELIDDYHALIRHLSGFLEGNKDADRLYIMLDEVTYCREWDRGVKYLADAGLLNRTILVITGSDSLIIREARMRFPGRRGHEAEVDFHLYPLSFADIVTLKNPEIDSDIKKSGQEVSTEVMQALYKVFEKYLIHGGFLTAINDMERNDEISTATLATYSDWIRGDVMKRGKQEQYLREIFEGVVKQYGTQVSWNSLATELSIDHPSTVADYLQLLERMDAVIIQPAIREDKLTAAPKKAKKVYFSDPFILHAIRAWLYPVTSPFAEQIEPMVSDAEWAGKLAETCAVAHYHRKYPTFYIKGEGEVDIAYVRDKRFWPVEVKWTGQIRPKDAKQIRKYSNGLICTKFQQRGSMGDIPTEPLPLNLLSLGSSPTTSIH